MIDRPSSRRSSSSTPGRERSCSASTCEARCRNTRTRPQSTLRASYVVAPKGAASARGRVEARAGAAGATAGQGTDAGSAPRRGGSGTSTVAPNSGSSVSRGTRGDPAGGKGSDIVLLLARLSGHRLQSGPQVAHEAADRAGRRPGRAGEGRGLEPPAGSRAHGVDVRAQGIPGDAAEHGDAERRLDLAVRVRPPLADGQRAQALRVAVGGEICAQAGDTTTDGVNVRKSGAGDEHHGVGRAKQRHRRMGGAQTTGVHQDVDAGRLEVGQDAAHGSPGGCQRGGLTGVRETRKQVPLLPQPQALLPQTVVGEPMLTGGDRQPDQAPRVIGTAAQEAREHAARPRHVRLDDENRPEPGEGESENGGGDPGSTLGAGEGDDRHQPCSAGRTAMVARPALPQVATVAAAAAGTVTLTTVLLVSGSSTVLTTTASTGAVRLSEGETLSWLPGV